MTPLQTARSVARESWSNRPERPGSIDSCLYAFQLALDCLVAHEEQSAELAVDMIAGKGEGAFVRRIFHLMRSFGVDVTCENLRRDLIVDGVVLEAKVIHVHTLFRKGFADFIHTKDLFALKSRAAGLLLAIVPHLRDSKHRKYPLNIGPHELERQGLVYEELPAAITERAEAFAHQHLIRLARRIPLSLEDEIDGRVDIILLFFARPD